MGNDSLGRGGAAMNKSAKLAIGMTVLLVACLLTAASNGAGPTKRADKGDKATAGKAETYVVVQVGEEFRVVAKSDYKSLPKMIRDEDNKAKKEYDEAKKAAIKNKEKFDTPKPLPRKIHKIGPSFKTEDDAKAWLDKHQEEEEKNGKKASAR
jgi:hypothetical protein